MNKLGKTIRLILNILFVVVVVAAIIVGWGKEVDDPDAWFPEWVEEKEEAAPSPAEPATPAEEKSEKLQK